VAGRLAGLPAWLLSQSVLGVFDAAEAALASLAEPSWYTSMPFGVHWKAALAYGTNYLLFIHGVSSLKRLLTMPIDFKRVAEEGNGSGNDDGGGGDMGDGPPASQLLVSAMNYGWERARRAAEVLDEGDVQHAGDSNDSNYGVPPAQSGHGQFYAGRGGGGGGGGFASPSSSSSSSSSSPSPFFPSSSSSSSSLSKASWAGGREWARLLDRQRRAVKRLGERLLQREKRAYELSGAETFLAALQRAFHGLIHWYWAPDGGIGGTMIVKVPLWNEQDLDMGLFDKIIRALAFQYVQKRERENPNQCADFLFYSLFVLA
jgi:hypothetical protein